ncbi:hypothetical protein [Antarcticirhabdus aurantiaca]|uniref:Uncharacterized protein n=1 Tax=Antarcticirhabdus aurantiaca TaxID=2606717 RepID=A0ACD4NRI6_9HYPH|nr:hypothetical protein OXU80_03555 [Jeongeuplla avenae]
MRLRPPILVEKPAGLPVSLDDVRAATRVSVDDVPEARLQSLVEAATAGFDGRTGQLGRALIHQVWRRDFTPIRGLMRLPFPDVVEASAVWIDAAGQEQPATVFLDEDVISPFVQLVGGWRSGAGVMLRVTFKAGYGAEPDDVPAPIREAIIKRVGQLLLEESEDGQLRSFAVDGAFTESYNSPEQRAAEVERSIARLVKSYRRGNVL